MPLRHSSYATVELVNRVRFQLVGLILFFLNKVTAVVRSYDS